jgi:hypothetical protein
LRETIREGTFAYSSLHVVDNDNLFNLLLTMKKKTLLHLPKLKQDIVKSIFHSDDKRYEGIVEKILERKRREKKKNEDTKV